MTIPYSHLTKGSLLIASPEMNAGIYFRAVLLICEHSQVGSFALMINKTLEVELPEELVNLNNAANSKVQVRAGGPIQPNQMMLLHTSDAMGAQAMRVCDGVYLGGDLQFLQEAINDASGPYINLCFGYAGWGAGALEREFLNGQWFLHPGSIKYIFETPPEKLWQTVLRDMGGKYATISMMPADLTLN